jgi:hypothetical protein
MSKVRGHDGHTYEDRVLSDDYDPDSDEDLNEVVRCPFCGAWAEAGQIERPSDYCHHDIAKAPDGR